MVRGVKGRAAPYVGQAERVAVAAHTSDHTMDNPGGVRVIDVAKAQFIHDGNGARAHCEDVAHNAADASPEQVELALFWTAQDWRLEIRDHGPGIDPAVAASLGTGFVSTKDQGLGVGLIVSQASINRLGGEVSLHPHPQGGTVTGIELPLHFAARAGWQA